MIARIKPARGARLNVDHPLARGLVWFAAPGPDHVFEFLHRAPLQLLASGSITSNYHTAMGTSLRSNSTSTGGGYYSFSPRLLEIKRDLTILVWAWMPGITSSGRVLTVPYASGTWVTPLVSIGLGREGSGSQGAFEYAANSSRILTTSDSGFISVNDGMTQYAVTRSGSSVIFYRNGAQHGAAKSAANGDVDWGAQQPITLLNRSNSSTGTGASGYMVLAAIWARALTADEIRTAYENPFALMEPPRRAAASGSTPPNTHTFNPGDDVQAVINAGSGGTTYIFNAGLYRLPGGNIQPKNGDTLRAAAGLNRDEVTLSGAKILTGWIFESTNGGRWYVTGQTQEGFFYSGDPLDRAQAGYERAIRPEDLFFDDVPLRHHTSLSALATGGWYFDYTADRIYIKDDPSGHLVETSVVNSSSEGLIRGSATGVTIENLTVEKVAVREQRGGIHGDNTSAWIIRNCIIRHVHGTGVNIGPSMVIEDSLITECGQMGFGGTGDDFIIRRSEVSWHNYARYDAGWEAGGSKIKYSNNAVVEDCYVHHTGAKGIWYDIDNRNGMIRRNLITDCSSPGIQYEISYGTTYIEDNILLRNGKGYDNWLWGSQILMHSGQGCIVRRNLCVVDSDGGNGIGVVNQNRGSGAYGVWTGKNNTITDNVIIYKGSAGASGVVTDFDNANFWATHNNVFNRNIYRVVSGQTGQSRYRWNDANRTITSLRSNDSQELDGYELLGVAADLDSTRWKSIQWRANSVGYRVNAGGSASAALLQVDGAQNFAADGSSPSNLHSPAGTFNGDNSYTISQIHSSVRSRTPMALFRSRRNVSSPDDLTWTFPFATDGYPSGRWEICLYWMANESAGSRVFNILIEGATVESNFDPASFAGGTLRACAKYYTVTADSPLTVLLDRVTGDPYVSGIEAWYVGPVATSPGNQTSNRGAVIDLPVSATDPGAGLIFRAQGLPLGLDIDDSTGDITGTVSMEAEDSYSTVVYVYNADYPNVANTLEWTWTISGGQTLSPSGIAVSVTVGAPALTVGAVNVAPSGIVVPIGLGAATIVPGERVLSPSGIAVSIAMGAPTIQTSAVIQPPGIATAITLGAPTVTRGAVALSPPGIATAITLGAPTVNVGAATIAPSGLAVPVMFGTPNLTPGDIPVAPPGIATPIALGTIEVVPNTTSISPPSLGSILTMGTPTVTVGAVTVAPAGLPVSIAMGTPVVTTGNVTVMPSSISVPMALGSPSVTVGAVSMTPTGVGIPVAFGNFTTQYDAVQIAPPGIAVPVTLGGIVLTPRYTITEVGGLGLPITPGTPTVTPGAVQVAPPGIAVPVVIGEPTLNVAGVQELEMTGIAVPIALGAPVIAPGPVMIAPGGIHVPITINIPIVQPGEVAITPVGVSLPSSLGNPAVARGAVEITPPALLLPITLGAPTVGVSNVVIAPVGLSLLHMGVPALIPGAVDIRPPGFQIPIAFGIPEVGDWRRPALIRATDSIDETMPAPTRRRVNVYDPGDLIYLHVTFSVRGQARDPETVRLRLKFPDGVTLMYTFDQEPSLVRVAVGIYRMLLVPMQEGDYYYRWEGTGPATGAIERRFHIRDSVFF
jgi:hypothetical protein